MKSQFISGGQGANVALQQIFGYGPNEVAGFATRAGTWSVWATGKSGIQSHASTTCCHARIPVRPRPGAPEHCQQQRGSRSGHIGCGIERCSFLRHRACQQHPHHPAGHLPAELKQRPSPLQNLSGVGQTAAAGYGSSSTTGATNVDKQPQRSDRPIVLVSLVPATLSALVLSDICGWK